MWTKKEINVDRKKSKTQLWQVGEKMNFKSQREHIIMYCMLCEKGLNAFAKSFCPTSASAVRAGWHGPKLFAIFKFSTYVKGLFYIMIQTVVR